MSHNNITLVSGYWPVKNKHTHESYSQWFNNTLKINQRMYFFCDKERNSQIAQHRKDYETIFVDHTIDKFLSHWYYKEDWYHPAHIPSIELGKIWHEKINMMKLAKDMDGENATDFYVWVDAGICAYRNSPPPSKLLNLKDVDELPHDSICYSESYPPEPEHKYAGTCHIIHKDLIDNIHHLYYEQVKLCGHKYKDWRCGSDQVVFTELMKAYPRLFTKISQGYGGNLIKLYDFC
jgi:hypothetical protein